MKGLIEREKLQRLAKEAVDHFQALFDARKEETLKKLAEKEYGIFFRRKRGEAWALENFEASSYSGGQNGGYYWKEYRGLRAAKDLLQMSSIGEVPQFLLEEGELNVIWTVAEEVT